jgi:transposase
MTRSTTYSPEVRARAVRMVFEHRGDHASEWAAIVSIASKIGCKAETLRLWLRRAERELRQANEILRKASAYFAMAELDRRFKP